MPDPSHYPLLCLAGAAPRLPGLAAQLHRDKSQADAYPEPRSSLHCTVTIITAPSAPGWLSCAAAGPGGSGLCLRNSGPAALRALGSPSRMGALVTMVFGCTYYFLLCCIIWVCSGLSKHFFDRCVALIPIPCHSRQEDTTQVIQ